jgi:hypothetical protein
MTNTNIATLRDYLKTQLAAAEGLSSVKSWRNGQPPVLSTAPFGWVRALGGAKEPAAASTKKVMNGFEIVVVCKNGDVDTAEDTALAYLKAIEDLIDADPTLNSQVSAAWVSNRDSEQWNEGRAHFAAWKVTVSSWTFN